MRNPRNSQLSKKRRSHRRLARHFRGRGWILARSRHQQPTSDSPPDSDEVLEPGTVRVAPKVVNGVLYRLIEKPLDGSRYPNLVTVEEPEEDEPGPDLLLVNTAHYLYSTAQEQGTLEAAIEQAIAEFENPS